MKFARMEMLFLFWGVPLLVLAIWYGWHRRRSILSRFASPQDLDRLVPPGVNGRRRLRAVLVIAAVLFLVLALAGPQYGYRWEEVERRGVDLMIALDCSRSMLGEDIQPSRLGRAKREIIDLLAMLEGDRVGLVAFSGTAFVQCPLTIDYSAFDIFLNALNPDYLPVGGTDLTAAVRTALAGFDPQSPADKAIILITDGEHTGQDDPHRAADAARQKGVTLFCIGVGSAQGVPVPEPQGGFKKDAQGQIVLTRLDEALLTRMAVTTGGTYARSVAGDMDLDAIYRDRIRGRMATATLESGRRQVWADRYQWPLGISLGLLLLAGAIPQVRKNGLGLILLVFVLLPLRTASAGPLQEGYRAYTQADYDTAVQGFVAAQLEDPLNPEVLYNLGNAYYKAGDFKSAQSHYQQALSGADAALRAKLLYNSGNAAYRQGTFKEAIQNYEAALKLDPDDRQARENLAFVKKRLEQQQKQQQSEQKSSKEPQGQPDKKQSEPSSGQANGQKQEADQNPSPKGEAPDPSDPAGGSPPPKPPEAGEAGGPSSEPEHKAISKSVAEQMLNRLRDEPGRALMPSYQKRHVEKDW